MFANLLCSVFLAAALAEDSAKSASTSKFMPANVETIANIKQASTILDKLSEGGDLNEQIRSTLEHIRQTVGNALEHGLDATFGTPLPDCPIRSDAGDLSQFMFQRPFYRGDEMSLRISLYFEAFQGPCSLRVKLPSEKLVTFILNPKIKRGTTGYNGEALKSSQRKQIFTGVSSNGNILDGMAIVNSGSLSYKFYIKKESNMEFGEYDFNEGRAKTMIVRNPDYENVDMILSTGNYTLTLHDNDDANHTMDIDGDVNITGTGFEKCININKKEKPFIYDITPLDLNCVTCGNNADSLPSLSEGILHFNYKNVANKPIVIECVILKKDPSSARKVDAVTYLLRLTPPKTWYE